MGENEWQSIIPWKRTSEQLPELNRPVFLYDQWRTFHEAIFRDFGVAGMKFKIKAYDFTNYAISEVQCWVYMSDLVKSLPEGICVL